jgi:hypothetical protein
VTTKESGKLRLHAESERADPAASSADSAAMAGNTMARPIGHRLEPGTVETWLHGNPLARRRLNDTQPSMGRRFHV